VNHREDAGIVFKTGVAENFQCPKRVSGNGVTGGAVAFYFHSGQVLKYLFRVQQIFSELLSAPTANHLVSIAMAADLMACPTDLPYKTGALLRYPPQNKKCGSNAALTEHFQ
jgi:hypothetical protein